MMRPFVKFVKDRFGEQPLIGVEVGVGKGRHAKMMIDCLTFEQLYLVDHWQPYYENGRLIDGFVSGYDNVKQLFDQYNFVSIMRLEAILAAEKFDNYFFDFIFIDANPSYETTKANINAWYPKIKRNGIFGGNNIHWEPTLGVITEFVKLNILPGFFKKENEWWICKQISNNEC